MKTNRGIPFAKLIIMNLASALFLLSPSLIAQNFGSVTDPRDGKSYKTISIGTQTWMAENLAFKLENSLQEQGQIFRKDSLANCFIDTINDLYYYRWDITKQICPTGWRIPTESDWNTLSIILGGRKPNTVKGNKTSGNKMMATDSIYWPDCPNKTNSSGFSGKPFGFYEIQIFRFFRSDTLNFDEYIISPIINFSRTNHIGKFANWWCKDNDGNGTIIWLSPSGLAKCLSSQMYLVPVRCIKD
jgi:uncharacterized protein (TIGR02145 family)